MNEYIVGDNLTILKTLPDKIASLIYIDPPFYNQQDFGDFDDRWSDIKVYSEMMRDRLIEAHRLLQSTGNLIVHVDSKASHHIRMLLDDIFGAKRFVNEIIWITNSNKKATKKLGRSHDTLVHYSKSNRYTFNPLYKQYDEAYLKTAKRDSDGRLFITSAAHNNQPDVIQRPNLRYIWNGHYKQWYFSKDTLQRLHDENRLHYGKAGIPRIKRYIDEMSGIPIRDVWDDIPSVQRGEKLDYATQKPIALLRRIITLYSNPEDLVIDFFAGSGTTGIAAMKNNRNYLLIDENPKGKDIFYKRMKDYE